MMSNKKGVAVFVAFMLGIVMFILGMALAPGLQQVAEESMLQLDCTANYLVNDSVTNENKAICTQLDTMMPLLTGLLFGLAGLLIGAVAVR